ncbi:hypothetical protein [uncultured Agrobacterium sp.]|uniref:hypothetical protein n=1 Tax=uncultured Agrobacterium sp. TaxID=157277 RepID=UPI0025D99AD3|nr:hypothetical protein [uncultured Agrobacterium sp.]
MTFDYLVYYRNVQGQLRSYTSQHAGVIDARDKAEAVSKLKRGMPQQVADTWESYQITPRRALL